VVFKISGESIPVWALIIYYLVLLFTLGATIFSLYKHKQKTFTLITLIITIIFPIAFIFGAIQRTEGNEFEFFLAQLTKGDFWAIYLLLSACVILFWWGIFFRLSKKKRIIDVSQ
jgi:hypothetical protein